MTSSCNYAAPSLSPSVSCSWSYLMERFSDEVFPRAYVTLLESTTGLAVGVLLALTAVVIAGRWSRVRSAVDGGALFSQIVPPVLLVPLLLYLPFAFLSTGLGPRVALGAVFSFFPIYQFTIAKLDRIRSQTAEVFQVYPRSGNELFRRVLLPLALPEVCTGIRTAAPLAVSGAVVGEWATGAGTGDFGLASTLLVAVRNLYANQALGSLFALIGVAAIVYGVVYCLTFPILRAKHLRKYAV